MQEKHLTYFKVENFKRFESFEMNNIGQFNLILGDNNVGKTSVLEALLFDLEDANQFRDNLLTVLYEYRKVEQEMENALSLFVKGKTFNLSVSYKNSELIFTIPVDISPDSLDIEFKDNNTSKKELANIAEIFIGGKRYNFITDQLIPYNSRIAKQNIPYIPFHVGYDDDLIHYYSKFIQDSETTEIKFINALKVAFPTISSIKVSLIEKDNRQNIGFLKLAQTDKDERIPLSMFGEGTIKLFRILMKIVVHRGKRLMIDEIDAGIHFKKFKDFWRTVLLAAKDNDVQIFATTHNLECLQAFKEVLEETKEVSEGIKMIDFQQDARCFELFELPNKQVEADTYTYSQFSGMLANGNNIRGGAI